MDNITPGENKSPGSLVNILDEIDKIELEQSGDVESQKELIADFLGTSFTESNRDTVAKNKVTSGIYDKVKETDPRTKLELVNLYVLLSEMTGVPLLEYLKSFKGKFDKVFDKDQLPNFNLHVTSDGELKPIDESKPIGAKFVALTCGDGEKENKKVNNTSKKASIPLSSIPHSLLPINGTNEEAGKHNKRTKAKNSGTLKLSDEEIKNLQKAMLTGSSDGSKNTKKKKSSFRFFNKDTDDDFEEVEDNSVDNSEEIAIDLTDLSNPETNAEEDSNEYMDIQQEDTTKEVVSKTSSTADSVNTVHVNTKDNTKKSNSTSNSVDILSILRNIERTDDTEFSIEQNGKLVIIRLPNRVIELEVDSDGNIVGLSLEDILEINNTIQELKTKRYDEAVSNIASTLQAELNDSSLEKFNIESKTVNTDTTDKEHNNNIFEDELDFETQVDTEDTEEISLEELDIPDLPPISPITPEDFSRDSSVEEEYEEETIQEEFIQEETLEKTVEEVIKEEVIQEEIQVEEIIITDTDVNHIKTDNIDITTADDILKKTVKSTAKNLIENFEGSVGGGDDITEFEREENIIDSEVYFFKHSDNQ